MHFLNSFFIFKSTIFLLFYAYMVNEYITGCEKHVYLSETTTNGKLGVLCSLILIKLHYIVMLLLRNITRIISESNQVIS